MANTVVGFFDSASEAQSAVAQLVENGFSRENIDVSTGNNTNTSDSSYTGSNAGTSDSSYTSSNAGTSDSSYTGSNTGTSDGSYSGSTNLTSGDTHRDSDHDSGNAVTRFFKNLFGGDDDEATRYSTVAQRSGAIVTVHTDSDDEAERAADLLDDYGAVNVDERASEYGYNRSTPMSDTTSGSMSDTSSTTMTDNTYGTVTGATSGTDSNTTSYDNINTNENVNTSGANRESVIPVIQEELQVGKRTVETGGVRVRSRVVQRPVEENIRLREERVTVERTPVNRVVSGDMANFQEQDIELTETAEVPVVNKEARVVEEIRVTKDASEREETIHDTVRNTEVDVENLEGTNRNKTTGYDTTTGSGNTNSNSGI